MREKEEVHNWVLSEFERLEKKVGKTSRYQGKRIEHGDKIRPKLTNQSLLRKKKHKVMMMKKRGGKCVKGNMIEER